MSSLAETKAGSEEQKPLEVKIGEIQTTVNPEIKETPCACGGMLRYETFPFSASWNGQRLEVEEVQGYRCNQEDCSVTLFPLPIGREMIWHIDRARGTLSFPQKVEGLLKGYSPEQEKL